MKLIPLTLIALLVTAIAAMAAQDCQLTPDGKYLVNPNAPGGSCTKSCRYQPSYENPDQCSHGSANPYAYGRAPEQLRRANPYLNAKCTCETPLISKTIGSGGFLFCGEDNDEWVYAGYPITMNLMAWQWRMSLKYSPEYKCG